jgi:hypothetical protein
VLALGGGVAGAEDLPAVVDRPGDAGLAAEGAEVAHPAVGPQKRMLLACGGGADPHDLAAVVDVGGVAGEAPEGAEVAHAAPLPQEGVLRAEAGQEAVANDLAALVDGARLAGRELVAERAQVDDLALSGVWCRGFGGRRGRDGEQATQEQRQGGSDNGTGVSHGPLPQG